MGKIKKIIVDHADWFRPVRDRSKSRYIDWAEERFSFGLEIDTPQVKKLQGHAAFDDKVWAPLTKLYLSALDDIAKDVRATEERLEQAVGSFEADQDWTVLLDKSRSERDALAQRIRSVHTKAVNKMKALATKTWVVESRRDLFLATAKWRIAVDDMVRPAGIGLDLGKLRISRPSDLRSWQAAVKDCVKACLDMSRLGRVLDKAESELRAELNGLDSALKKDADALDSGAQRLSVARQAFLARVLVVGEAADKAKAALGDATEAAAKTHKQCKLKKAVDQIAQSERELLALGKRIDAVLTHCSVLAKEEAGLGKLQNALASLSDPQGTDKAAKLSRRAENALAKSMSQNAGAWDEVGKIATRAMGSVVNANKIFARHEAQLKKKPGDINVSFVG